jgi:hypothetical protein
MHPEGPSLIYQMCGVDSSDLYTTFHGDHPEWLFLNSNIEYLGKFVEIVETVAPTTKAPVPTPAPVEAPLPSPQQPEPKLLKKAPPLEGKCGSLATDSGVGGAGGQAKGCSRLGNNGGRRRQRKIKGI